MKNRAGNSSYKLMEDVKKGDFIINNAGGKITAISRVKEWPKQNLFDVAI